MHFKELITLAGNGEVATLTLEKGLWLPPGSQPTGQPWLNHGLEWFPSPTGWLFCLTPHPAGMEVHCGFFLIGEYPLYSPKKSKIVNLKEIISENKLLNYKVEIYLVFKNSG